MKGKISCGLDATRNADVKEVKEVEEVKEKRGGDLTQSSQRRHRGREE
jgi:hypothetical protein